MTAYVSPEQRRGPALDALLAAQHDRNCAVLAAALGQPLVAWWVLRVWSEKAPLQDRRAERRAAKRAAQTKEETNAD